jgi:cellobiose phosphorylase
VFVTFQVRFGLSVYADIAKRLGWLIEQAWADTERKKLDEKIAKVCWDGDWFIWAIAEDGTVFGTKNYPEGQVYLNTQVWAVLSGAATAGQTEKALSAVKTRLASPWGAALCNPPFVKTPVKVMRAVLFNPGTKENGGIFSHTQSWAVLAETARGHGDQAYAYFRAFMPAAQNDRAEIREIEPYVHCQSTHAPESKKYGRSRIPWLSGTASWSYYAATQHILGIRPELDGLRIDPCVPKSWEGFRVTRHYRGKRLNIEIKNPSHLNRGVRALLVDGQAITGNLVRADQLKDGSTVVAVLES